jgi:hypothetical protein
VSTAEHTQDLGSTAGGNCRRALGADALQLCEPASNNNVGGLTVSLKPDGRCFVPKLNATERLIGHGWLRRLRAHALANTLLTEFAYQ